MTRGIGFEGRVAVLGGGFQQVDGRRVFVSRLGGGGPAVVFLPGAGAVGLDYLGVQQGVSRFTTAVENEGASSRPENMTPVFSLIVEGSPAWQRIIDVLALRTKRRGITVSGS